jgi:hypothetical protein
MESAAKREVLCLWLPESIELFRRFPDSSRLLSFDPIRGLFRSARSNHSPNRLPTILFVSCTLDFLRDHPAALATLSTSALEIIAKAVMDDLAYTVRTLVDLRSECPAKSRYLLRREIVVACRILLCIVAHKPEECREWIMTKPLFEKDSTGQPRYIIEGIYGWVVASDGQLLLEKRSAVRNILELVMSATGVPFCPAGLGYTMSENRLRLQQLSNREEKFFAIKWPSCHYCGKVEALEAEGERKAFARCGGCSVSLRSFP